MNDIGTAIHALKLAMARAGASGEATVTLHREDLHLVEAAIKASMFHTALWPSYQQPTERPIDGFNFAGIKFRPEPRSALNPLRQFA